MRAMLWRALYVLIAFVVFWWIAPLFASFVGLPALSGQVLQLIKIIVACLAVLYVLFGPQPRTPW